MTDILKAAIKAGGGPGHLAKTLGNLSSQAISQWKEIPVRKVLEVEAATGISRHDLRPDIYPLDGRYNNKRETND